MMKYLIPVFFFVVSAGCTQNSSTPFPASSAASSAATVVVSSTAAIVPLTDAAYRCELSVPDDAGATSQGSIMRIKVKVTNRSPELWSTRRENVYTKGSVAVAFHWLDEEGKWKKEGDRALLPADLPPGESAEVSVPVVARVEPGTYTLQVEPVNEGVAWFSSKKGCFAHTRVKITR